MGADGGFWDWEQEAERRDRAADERDQDAAAQDELADERDRFSRRRVAAGWRRSSAAQNNTPRAKPTPSRYWHRVPLRQQPTATVAPGSCDNGG